LKDGQSGQIGFLSGNSFFHMKSANHAGLHKSLMYAPRVWGGGMESHIYELTVELLARNVEVTLAVCSKFGCATGRREKLIALGARFVDLGEGGRTAMDKIRDLASRRANLRDLGNVNTIVCHGVGMSHVLAAAEKQGARLVWHDHLSGGETMTKQREFSPPELKRYPWLFRRFLGRVDAVITGSERGRENLRNFQFIQGEVHVIPPLCLLPDTLSAPQRQRSGGVTCGIFGNLSPQKGTEPLLKLWSHQDLSHIRLLVFGNDHDKAYEKLARNLGLRNVEFRGPYSESKLAEHAAEVDFGIIASAIEGYPLVAIELMACGVSLVATKVGACPEFDPSGKNVILAEHDAESLRRAIVRMVEQVENGEIDRRAAQRRAREIYDRRSIVKRYLEVIGASERTRKTQKDTPLPLGVNGD
jgi:glycosyltransferase involved in cell wall biosynthesis